MHQATNAGTNQTMNWQPIRAEFPVCSEWAYLNTAAFGMMPKRATDAMEQHFAHRNALACTDFLDWYSRLNQLRESAARLIGARAEDIAFVPNTASALAVVIANLDLKPRDNIVTLADEFPNYQYMPAARKIPPEGLIDGRFFEAIDERTRLICVSHVNYSTGLRAPVEAISRYAADRGIPLFVDGTQSVGAMRFDVSETPVSVLAIHAYKWLISPSGAGFMYVAPEFRESLQPLVIGWRSHHDWRSIDNFHTAAPVFPASAEKYEGAGLPVSLLLALQASLDWILEIGPAVVEARTLELAQRCREIVRNLGGESLDAGSQIANARFPGADVSELAAQLKREKVVVAARAGNLRISPHFYNNEEDLDRLETGLKRALA